MAEIKAYENASKVHIPTKGKAVIFFDASDEKIKIKEFGGGVFDLINSAEIQQLLEFRTNQIDVVNVDFNDRITALENA